MDDLLFENQQRLGDQLFLDLPEAGAQQPHCAKALDGGGSDWVRGDFSGGVTVSQWDTDFLHHGQAMMDPSTSKVSGSHERDEVGAMTVYGDKCHLR
jgi:hypothetical protein